MFTLTIWAILNVCACSLISARDDKDLIWGDFKKILKKRNNIKLEDVLTDIFLKIGSVVFLFIALPFSIPFSIAYLWTK